MDGPPLACASLVLAVSTALFGCGDDGAMTTTPPRAKQASLPRVIQPRCGMESFRSPEIRRAPTEDGRGSRWTLEYNPKQGSKTAFTKLLLIEYPPTNRSLTRPARAQTTTVAGHRLNITTADRGSDVYTAQWQTRRAVYTVLAQTPGKLRALTPPPVERLVDCLP